MAKLLSSFSACIYLSTVFNTCFSIGQHSDGFNIYKDIQIGKSNEILREGENRASVIKDELVLPSVAAKFNIDDTSKRNRILKNFLPREYPDLESMIEEVPVPNSVFAFLALHDSMATVPRLVKIIDRKSRDKKSDLRGYYKRTPGSVLTYTLTSSKPAPRFDLRPESERHRYLQPSSFIATMGKRYNTDY